MKKMISLAAALVTALAMTACGGTSQAPSSQSPAADSAPEGTAGVSSRADDAPESAPADADSSTGQETGAGGVLVAYFSLAGEQYGVGVIEEGNTSIIAHMIAGQTGADLFEIEPVTPYPETYSELLDVSRGEMEDSARPEIAGTVENMADYDTVFIGYPNWWGDMPMIVYNFLESYDFSGKTIVPFCTHGGSGFSGTEGTIADITGGEMKDGLAIAGTTAQNDRDRSREEVTAWLREGGFIE